MKVHHNSLYFDIIFTNVLGLKTINKIAIEHDDLTDKIKYFSKISVIEEELYSLVECKNLINNS